MKNYAETIQNKIHYFDSQFDGADLNPDFIPYYENQKRIEVNFAYGETKRGTISMTTGWKPVFLLMLTKRSRSSSYVIHKNDKFIKVIK